MEYNSHDDKADGKHSGVGFVETSKIFATRDEFFFETLGFFRQTTFHNDQAITYSRLTRTMNMMLHPWTL